MDTTSHPQAVDAGTLGFDADAPIAKATAEAAFKAGYRFAVRYLSRSASPPPSDLTVEEVGDILSAGLGLMAAQHVEKGKWTPSEALGIGYGKTAAAHAKSVGLPAGTSIWLDLEEVAIGTPVDDTVAYCNAWFNEVATAGYTTGVYVGSNCGLSADELYLRLKTQHYWKSISHVPQPTHRGYCMVQHQFPNDTINKIAIDRNATFVDALGSRPVMAVGAPAAPLAAASLVSASSPAVLIVPGSDESVLRTLASRFDLSAPIDYLISFRDARGAPRSARYWAIVNFDLRSSIPRLFLFDVQMSNVETYLCAHGIGSDGGADDGYTRVFSNVPGSNCSSLGVYSCAETYAGKHGYSLRIDGLEGTNSNARTRDVVIHSAPYVSDAIAKTGRIGRSDGCFAVDPTYITDIVSHLTAGSLLLAWSTKSKPDSQTLVVASAGKIWSELEPPAGPMLAAAPEVVDSAAEVATAILKSNRIILARAHSQSTLDNATAYQNIVDTATEKPASRSPNVGAPGGTVFLNVHMLKGVLALSEAFTLSVSEFCGGTHNPNSRHYIGCAVDINVINGQHVSSANPFVGLAKQKCRDLGATEILGPGDPNHSTHVHAGWPRPS